VRFYDTALGTQSFFSFLKYLPLISRKAFLTEPRETNKNDNKTRRRQTKPTELLNPEAGTATSSPDDLTSSPTILSVMLWMKKEAYEESILSHAKTC
jgi:hypothetical protein